MSHLLCPDIRATICMDKIIKYITTHFENNGYNSCYSQSEKAKDFCTFAYLYVHESDNDEADDIQCFLQTLDQMHLDDFKFGLLMEMKTWEHNPLLCDLIITYYESYVRD